jgi:hypothetical protein
MRMQAPVSCLESTVLELDAKVTRALEVAERALWRTADPSDEMPHETNRLDTEIEARLQSAIGALEATRAEFHLKTNRAIDAGNRALGRVSELSAQWAELPELNARVAMVEASMAASHETIGRLEGAMRLLEERLTSLAQHERPEAPPPPPPSGLAELLAALLESVRGLLPARVSGWLGMAAER